MREPLVTMIRKDERRYRFVAGGLLCLGLAVVAYGALQLTLGATPAEIHVRWAPDVDDTMRKHAEERYGLSEGQSLERRTWAYLLRDTSSTNIRALVSDRAVEDTGDIDRASFRVTPESTSDQFPVAPYPAISASLWGVIVLCLFCGLLSIGIGVAPGIPATWRDRQQADVVPLLPRQRHLVILLLGVLLALDVASMQHQTLTYDETNHFDYGESILRLDATRLGRGNSEMPITALNGLPRALGDGMLHAPVAWFLRRPDTGPYLAAFRSFLEQTESGRYVTVVFSLLVALCVFAWTRGLYGANAGLLALALYTFDPNLLAHSQLITTDVYALGTITFTLYYFWKFLRHGGWRLGATSAVMLGLALTSKYTAIVLFPLLAVIAVVFHSKELVRDVREGRLGALRQRAVSFAGGALLIVVLSLLVINVGFLFDRTFTPLNQYAFRSSLFRSVQSSAGLLGALPVPVPYPYLEGLDWVIENERTGHGFGRIYLLGDLRAGQGFAGYYFYACLYKLPIATQLVLLAAVIAYIVRWRRFDVLKNEAVLLVPLLFFTIYFNFFYRAQIGLRYFLVVMPLLYVLCGSLIAKTRALTRPVAAALMAAMAGLILSVLSYYPHFLPYFNELVWDRTQAYKILADSNIDWGQNGWYLEQYLASHPNAVVDPDRPTAGTILVHVNKLTGVTEDPETFRWLREHFTPVDHVAYAVVVYNISPSDLQRIGAHGN